jgi:peptidyl-prolyl cis-trans isomerase SurA
MSKMTSAPTSAARAVLFVLAAIAAIVPGPGQRAAAQKQGDVLDKVVAVVGKEAIFQSDLKAQTEFYAVSNKVNPETPGLREQVLDAMINEKLLLAEAQRDTNVRVTEDQVTTRLDELIAQRIANPQIGSEKRLEELYGMPVSRMKREFRDEMRKQIMAQQLQQIHFDAVTVSRREVEEFFVTYKDSLPEVPEELEIYHVFRYPRVSAAMRDAILVKARAVISATSRGATPRTRRRPPPAATSGSGSAASSCPISRRSCSP